MASRAILGLSSNPYVIAILLPIAASIGITPVQFGIIMVLNCGIGLLTPPVGAVLFIGSAVGHCKMEKVVLLGN